MNVTRTGWAGPIPILIMLILTGCAGGQRLGESAIEARRYSRGWHVNAPKSGPSAGRTAEAKHEAPIQEGEVRSTGVSGVNSLTFIPGDGDGLVAVREAGLPPSHPHVPLAAHSVIGQSTTTWARAEGFGPAEPLVVPAEGPEAAADLPEPIQGRHPDAVPGFFLSLGWLIGSIGSNALGNLGVPNAGIAITLGLVASIIGFLISRNAHRVASAHPDRYPRRGLSRAARWVALAPILLALAWLALVVIIFGILAMF